ncbi:permease-like cell division protein FtsX [Chromobacterium violaceum]|uniref:permease-like cell division protein FtsX n=1 Tax=Chromobacterium violaceum TaxID=536 RepID=UPI001B344E1E|nr:permease-like cell division protein FtsX [Chromobacterium violaceum]MBP4047032.1 permease-like cell division protein FtsX [Chromobacterium violaceum]MBT2866120.1 ABC transporter permease [Chromobacterium violaceum]
MKHFLYLNWQSAKQALAKIVRQPFGSLLTLLMLALALALPLSLYLAVSSVQEWVGRLTATPQITLFMEQAAEQADIAAVNSTLSHHPKVKSFTFVSKGQALQDLEKRNGLTGLSDGLDANPLPDAFVVTPKSLEPRELDMLQKELSGLPMVELAQFDASWAKRLYGMVEMGKKMTWFLAAALGLALVLVTHNAIRMQILARQDEIEVSKLIGATDSFIRRPFMYHALWQGVLAALLAWGLSSWLAAMANPAIREFAMLYGERVELRALNLPELAALIGVSAALAMLGARLAADHHLRKVEPK